MHDITIVLLIWFVAIWVYSIVSIFSGEFKEKKQKVFWTIAVIFVPFLALFYIFMKKNLLK